MYITRTEGPSLPNKQAKASQPKLKSDSSFEETVITLLSDAVELTNPNDERREHEQQQQKGRPPLHGETPELPAETAGIKKTGLSVSA